MKQVALSVIFRICCFDGRILISENRFEKIAMEIFHLEKKEGVL